MRVRKNKQPVKYPRLRDYNLDRRFKLSVNDIAEIRQMRKEGNTYEVIATHFKISHATVGYYVNDEFREKQKAKNAKKKGGKPAEYTRYARRVLCKEHREHLTYIKWKKDNEKRGIIKPARNLLY